MPVAPNRASLSSAIPTLSKDEKLSKTEAYNSSNRPLEYNLSTSQGDTLDNPLQPDSDNAYLLDKNLQTL